MSHYKKIKFTGMKNIISVIIFSVIILFGCSESFLDKQPEDTLAPGIFFKTPADIKTGLAAAYKPLHSIYAVNALPYYIESMSDDNNQGGGDFMTYNKDNTSSVSSLWTNFYKLIVNANNIIDIIDGFTPKTSAEGVVIKAYRGEACFLRAFSYFNLVRLYGDVPMFVKRFNDPGTAFGIGRTPVSEIYDKVIIPDLEYAFENCYKKGDAALGDEGARVTKGAALTILGEVYLTLNDHANAAATLKKLIVDKEAGDKYALLADYSQIWLPSKKFHSESVFEVNFNVAAGYPSYFFRNMHGTLGVNTYKLTTISSYIIGTKTLMDEFYNNQDWTRYEVSVDSGYSVTNGLLCCPPLKLTPPLNSTLKTYDKVGTDYNYMITRYADALLMYAEALMVLGQKDAAAGYVNQVRARVDMASVTAADMTIDRILHERRMELAFEGHRWFDLVRTGKAISILSQKLMTASDYDLKIHRTEPIPEYQLILPIPVAEIQKDQTLTQNPGY
jgi:hypothetical protein